MRRLSAEVDAPSSNRTPGDHRRLSSAPEDWDLQVDAKAGEFKVYAQSGFGRQLQASAPGAWDTALGAQVAEDGAEIVAAYSSAGASGYTTNGVSLPLSVSPPAMRPDGRPPCLSA